jgi:RNA polymerase sigma-70 factor (ECF subfamily)
MFPATSKSLETSGGHFPAHLGSFETTHWSVVLAAGGDSPASDKALEQLCRTYWYPLYAFVRRTGHSAHDAQDLTQGFFAELFRKNYFRAADRERGKFRSFLLTALRHFLAHEWEKGKAAKRGGGFGPVSWDEEMAEDWYQHEPAKPGASAERVYDRAWALRVFEKALERLRSEADEQGNGLQFDTIKSFLTKEPGAGAYPSIASSLDMSPNAVAVAVHRLRQRYAIMVRQMVADTVAQDGQVEEELDYLISLVCD